MTALSVLIATFNRSEDLKIVLDCLQKQTLPDPLDYEVLIIDNNSNDNTKLVVESLLPAFQGKLKYFFEPRQGKPFAVNRGLKEAKGEIIVLTDDDCTVESNYLEKIYGTFQDNDPTVGFIGGRIAPRWVNCSKPEWFDHLEPDWFKEFFWGPLAILDYGDKPFITNRHLYDSLGKKLFYGANMAVRKELFLKYGDLNLERPVTEDMEFQLRFLKEGAQGLYAPHIQVYHKVSAGRLTPQYYYRWYFGRGIHMDIQEVHQTKFYHPFGIPFIFVGKTLKLFVKSVLTRSYTEKMHHRCRAFFNLGQMVQIVKGEIRSVKSKITKARLKSLIFEQKCMPWFVIERWRKFYWRMDWEIKHGCPRLKEFVFKQKCLPRFVIERWRKFYWRMDWEIKHGCPRLQEFVFKQKCMPRFMIERWRKFYWRMDWEIKQARIRLKDFVFKQKCMPWFVILRWRKFIQGCAPPSSKWKIPGVPRFQKTMTQLNWQGIVLMYHRVKDLDCDPWQLCVTPNRFEEHMRVLRKYGRPVQMREMGKSLNHFSVGDKKIVLSFDDGYSDNFYNAKPILEHYEIPATFFIVSGAVGSREEYWWDELERIILCASTLPAIFELTIVGIEYRFPIMAEAENERQNYGRTEEDIPQNNTVLSKGELYFALWRILSRLSFEEKKVALRQIAQWSGQSSIPRQTHLPMTSQELVSLARCPLFEIGAHTVSHPLLANLTPQEQENEIVRSKHDLEKMIGRPVTSFCYPHGNYSDETPKIIEQAQFRAASTVTEKAVVRNDNPYLLPRFAVLNWDANEFESKLKAWLLLN